MGSPVISIQELGNQYRIVFGDDSQVLAYPGIGTIMPVASARNSNNLIFIQELGNQIKAVYADGNFQIAVPANSNNLWYAGAVQGSGHDGKPTPNWGWPLAPHAGMTAIQNFNNIPPGPANGHDGIDLEYSGITGDPIYSITDSVVVDSGFNSGNGNGIKLQAYDGSFYIFYHMVAPTPLSIGQSVPYSTVVGNVGMTGTNATGPHCHFGTSETGWPGFQSIYADMEDPRIFMSNRGQPYPY